MEDELIKLPNLQMVMKEIAIEIRNDYAKNLNDNGHPTTENKLVSSILGNSVETMCHFDGMDYWIGLQLEDYWKYVEYDTNPHFPPVDAILNWIKIKPILPHPDKNGKLPTPKQLAYLIGRKISIDGTKGTNDLGNAVSEVDKSYNDRIIEAIDKDMHNNIDNIIKVLYK